MTTHQPARDAIALKLRAYFTDVVRDRQDRAWTRADELLNAWAHELAEQQRTEMRAPGRSYDASRWNRCVDMVAGLIDPKEAK